MTKPLSLGRHAEGLGEVWLNTVFLFPSSGRGVGARLVGHASPNSSAWLSEKGAGEVTDMKNWKRCLKCEELNDINAAFCHYCGRTLEDAEEV
ncbi:MAG: zinc ribbon domain-containing protein [Candidatus Caldarchaeum sp.]